MGDYMNTVDAKALDDRRKLAVYGTPVVADGYRIQLYRMVEQDERDFKYFGAVTSRQTPKPNANGMV